MTHIEHLDTMTPSDLGVGMLFHKHVFFCKNHILQSAFLVKLDKDNVCQNLKNILLVLQEALNRNVFDNIYLAEHSYFTYFIRTSIRIFFVIEFSISTMVFWEVNKKIKLIELPKYICRYALCTFDDTLFFQVLGMVWSSSLQLCLCIIHASLPGVYSISFCHSAGNCCGRDAIQSGQHPVSTVFFIMIDVKSRTHCNSQ